MASGSELASDQLRPRLLKGESVQAFLSAAFLHTSEQARPITTELHNPIQLRSLLSVGHCSVSNSTDKRYLRASGSIRISPGISDDTLLSLIDNGLQARFSKSCEGWKLRKSASDKDFDLSMKENSDRMVRELAKNADIRDRTILGALLDRVSASFPYVYTGHLGWPLLTLFCSMLDPKLLVPESRINCELLHRGED